MGFFKLPYNFLKSYVFLILLFFIFTFASGGFIGGNIN